jgi:DNA-binding MarR family transcriptional regulator
LKPDAREKREALRLAEFLPYRLNVLATVVSEGLARIYAERFGIGIPEWRVLATLGEFGAMTATAIGRHSHMGKVKVSRAVAALAARGLVARERDGEDLRAAFLVLTREGQRMYRQIAPLALDFTARLTAELDARDLAAFDRLVIALTERAAALRGE